VDGNSPRPDLRDFEAVVEQDDVGVGARTERAFFEVNSQDFGGVHGEHLHGARDEASTRALIAQENRRYARRQLIWFRKEPNLTWFDGPGESPSTIAAVHHFLDEQHVTRF